MVSQFYGDSIFWIEVDKIKPNPYQPRREFDEQALNSLADSIRQYGVLQPLVVTRQEVLKEDGGLVTIYELVSGERRFRASKLAGLQQIPAVIRSGTDDARTKLELAIIENLQREDLNPVERARAFQRLVDEFGFKHTQIAEKVGKSREYISNTVRILALPEEMITALSEGKITEGHTRPLLMLSERPEEQQTLFKEIIYKRLTVRESEAISRKVAFERARKKEIMVDPEIVEMENKIAESLGTRVHIEKNERGGQVKIDFFSVEDLRSILTVLETNKPKDMNHMLNNHISKIQSGEIKLPEKPPQVSVKEVIEENERLSKEKETVLPNEAPIDDRSKDEVEQADEELYSIKNFSL